MQFAKDSFYIAMRDRLSEANPARTVTVEGVVRPAVVVAENENDASALNDAFALTWGEVRPVGNGTKVMKMDCVIEYATRGTNATNGDRGRVLGGLDADLMAMSQPPRVQKTNYTIVPPQSMGTMMFWTDVEFGAPKDGNGRISREAKTTIYFYNEVAQ
jgi:hypothetical protein